MSLADVMVNIGTLPAGENVVIMFNVTVDNPYEGATNQVSNQGTVSGTNFTSRAHRRPGRGRRGRPDRDHH